MGCSEKKLSKNLTQTFMAYCNVMICQQATLSGEAERPKVADAVIEAELGYFALSELTSIRGNLGLPVERDRYFQPTRLSAIKTLCGYNR
jgi:Protein of unknown function (DUF2958)